jgi:hypothetical protein
MSDLEAVGRCAPGPDERNRRLLPEESQACDVTARVEERGRVGRLEQPLGETRIMATDRGQAGLGSFAAGARRVKAREQALQGAPVPPADCLD